jgi:hypothetical protein
MTLDSQKSNKGSTMEIEAAVLKNRQDSNIDKGERVQIDRDVESKVYQKFDKYLLPQVALLTILAYLDRTNIGKKVRRDTLQSQD